MKRVMQLEWSFTLANKNEADTVFALYQSLIGKNGCTWNREYPARVMVDEDIASGSLYVLKDKQGSLIAAASAGPFDELSEFAWDMPTPCELARVAVSLTCQGQGVGSYLLRHIIPAVKARGFDGIRMLVSVTNQSALALYDKNGFERLDTVHLYDLDFYRYRMVFPLLNNQS